MAPRPHDSHYRVKSVTDSQEQVTHGSKSYREVGTKNVAERWPRDDEGPDGCLLSDIVLIWVSESETTLNLSSCIERNDGVGDASGGGGDLNVGVVES